MAFFKTTSLRQHAVKIADDFRVVRRQHFGRVLRAIEKEVEFRFVSGNRELGGDADRALKAFQLVIFTFFWNEHPYFPKGDFRDFAGHLINAVTGADQRRVDVYYREFVAYQERAIRERSEEAQAELFRRLSIPIAGYTVPEPNPIAWAIAARLMPLFTIGTQMVIAKEFGDHQTLRVLQAQA